MGPPQQTPSFLNKRPPPGAPLSADDAAQKVTSGAGAVGQAAPQTAPTCKLLAVATNDSVSNYGTHAAPLMTPAAGASAEVRILCYVDVW